LRHGADIAILIGRHAAIDGDGAAARLRRYIPGVRGCRAVDQNVTALRDSADITGRCSLHVAVDGDAAALHRFRRGAGLRIYKAMDQNVAIRRLQLRQFSCRNGAVILIRADDDGTIIRHGMNILARRDRTVDRDISFAIDTVSI